METWCSSNFSQVKNQLPFIPFKYQERPTRIFYLTRLMCNQEKGLWEYPKWSPKGKCLDFFVIFSQLFFKEMNVGKSREFVCAYLGLEGEGENNSFSLPVIWFQIVMVSPGTHLVKNHEFHNNCHRNYMSRIFIF